MKRFTEYQKLRPMDYIVRGACGLLILFSLPSAYAQTPVGSEYDLQSLRVSNVLQPFKSDGCSKFPDGIPLVNSQQWRHCCIDHDISYWQGGTREDRRIADEKLNTCVSETGADTIGNAMEVGVRVGGHVGLPTTWRWGYGWIQNRGYRELTPSELEQVEYHLAQLPTDRSQIPISKSKILISERKQLNADYCLDEMARVLASKFGDEVNADVLDEKIHEGAEGYFKTYSVEVSTCAAPINFEFHLLRRDACTKPVSELLARGRVRLKKVHMPEGC